MQVISMGVREAKINLSKLLKLVKEGKEVLTVLARIKRENFINYLKEHYLAKNTMVIVAGDAEKIKSANWRTKIKSYFTNIKLGKPQSKERVVEKQKGRRCRDSGTSPR